ncbi:hypothetical protein BU23DRAFT_16930 [Bimuria novae-zelandiae CBS 107.79]|uniref:N-acetyltransferase domain-containing protein n=1 Tax=Bimuria novae-zelandiae CBS 107.79 TaxID=1447943 RepID=A0A6A5UN01_9PLEO|nr:hypothetical protein BU23DRAFT_16930 [Bimuria novae-zelandiae CBS 107.79]
MRVNEKIALLAPRVLLVPYSPHHVPTYHAWMQDPSLQQATASEPLTLEEEYAMQTSWRTDADKLTFIVCMPPPSVPDHITAEKDDAPQAMIGDVNMFLSADDEEDGGKSDGLQALVGEIEIMIAEKKERGKGLGRDILVAFVWYIMNSHAIIMEEYRNGNGNGKMRSYLKMLRVKIYKDNVRSIKLFESIGFQKKGDEPNYFGELELRWILDDDSRKDVEARMTAIPKSLAYKS